MEKFRNLPNINMPQAEIIKRIFGEERSDVVEAYWRFYQEERLKSHHIFVAIVSNQEQAVLGSIHFVI